MFKTALCIKMLMILYTRGVVSVGDLAKELDTNPRNIPEYRKELEAAGYPIETVSGRYGGYRLRGSDYFPSVTLTDAEKKALVDSFEYLTKQRGFPSMPAYKTAMEKIMARNRYRTARNEELIMIPRQPFSMSEEEIGARYAAISECIDARTKLKIEFLSNDNVVRERVIHPYKLYVYHNAWFVLAYCESMQMILPFKLNRIERFSVLSQRFDYVYSYREGGEWHEHLNEQGMKKVPDWSGELGGKDAPMRIRLRLSGKPAMYVKEYLYGTDQIVTAVDKDTTILEFTAKYKYNTVQMVLGFGTDCEVLEPEWLKNEVLSQVEKIKTMYAAKK